MLVACIWLASFMLSCSCSFSKAQWDFHTNLKAISFILDEKFQETNVRRIYIQKQEIGSHTHQSFNEDAELQF